LNECGFAPTMECMFPIAQINSHALMQRSMVGASASDPVVPERSRRRRRRAARQRAPRRALVLKLRGTS
jgi:hypothetical protein